MRDSLKRFIAHPNFFRYITLGLLGGFCLLALIQSLSGILAPFFCGIIGAYLLNKIAKHFDPYMNRGITAGLLIVILIAMISLLSATAFPHIQSECIYLAKELPLFAERLLEKGQELFATNSFMNHDNATLQNTLHTQVSTYLGDIVQWVIKATGNLLTNGLLIANTLSLMVLTPIIMFYLLRDWPTIMKQINNLLGNKSNNIYHKIDQTLSSYLSGQSIVCLILTVLYTFGLWLTGLSKPILIGCLSGILSFIPYLGLITGLISALSIAFADFIGWGQVIGVITVFITVSLIESNVLIPRFVGNRIGLHPVWILFAVLTGGSWFGFPGVLIAIPTAAIIGVLMKEWCQCSKN